MPRSTRFEEWFIEVRDDIRQEVVERGWYGREVTEDTQHQAALEPSQEALEPSQDAEMEALYGQDIEQPEPEISGPEQEP